MAEFVIIPMHDLDGHLHDGWRWANTEDVHHNRHNIDPMLSEWAIVGLENGKVDGPGYGGAVHEGGFGPECGEVLVVREHGYGGGMHHEVVEEVHEVVEEVVHHGGGGFVYEGPNIEFNETRGLSFAQTADHVAGDGGRLPETAEL